MLTYTQAELLTTSIQKGRNLFPTGTLSVADVSDHHGFSYFICGVAEQLGGVYPKPLEKV